MPGAPIGLDYRLTPAGRKQLIEQTTRWDRLVEVIGQIMHPAGTSWRRLSSLA